MSKQEIGILAVVLLAGYLIIKLLFDLLLRGFAPIVSSRPWVIQSLIEELHKEKIPESPTIYSLSCGKSGFLYFVGMNFQDATLIGVEKRLLPYVIAKLQSIVRFLNIKVLYSRHFHRLDLTKADIIYCYVGINVLRELSDKFKFECKPGTIIISIGFPIPGLSELRVIAIPQRIGKSFSWFTKKQLKPKPNENLRAHYIYFYKI